MVLALKNQTVTRAFGKLGNIPIKNPWRFVEGKYFLLFSVRILVTLTVLKITFKC